MASLGAGGLALLVLVAPQASSVNVRATEGLQSGTYQVVVKTGGKMYRSVWHLRVVANRINGTSEWECCPGHRVDRLSGKITDSDQVTITRFCAGQGQPSPCQQVYEGSLSNTRIEGTWSGTGSAGGGAAWTLYLDRMDIKFTVRAGGGRGYLLVDDAQLLGGGRLVDLSYYNHAQKVAAVVALRLQYSGGPEVRASLRATSRTQGVLSHEEDPDYETNLIVGPLQVFQSTAPTGRTRYGCPQVGQSVALLMKETITDKVSLTLECSSRHRILLVDAGEAAVTITAIKGS
jgi:hypothetical protein